MTDIYESMKASATAEFKETLERAPRRHNPAHVLTNMVERATACLAQRRLVADLVLARPEILDLAAPLYARPSSAAEYILSAVKHRLREELTAELMLDALREFYDVPGTFLSNVRTAVEASAVIAGALPHEVPEFFEIDFGWYSALADDGVTQTALDGLTDLYAAMRPLIVDDKFEPRVTGLCGPSADDVTARMLAFIGSAAVYHGAAVAARVAEELAEERLSTARQMV